MNWNQFEAIHPSLLEKLQSNGFKSPTQVQTEVLQHYSRNKYMIIASQTGSGKTLAFGIPVISEILRNQNQYPKKQIIALVLTPTRELAMQIYKHIKAITNLTIGCLVGGMSKEKQRRVINSAPTIFIATPGRLWDFIENEENEVLKKLNLIKFLVIDEADRMVELGHFPQLDNIMTKITSPSQITHDKARIMEMLKGKSEAVYLGDQKITFEIEKPVEMSYEDFLKLQQGKGDIIEQNEDKHEIEEIDQEGEEEGEQEEVQEEVEEEVEQEVEEEEQGEDEQDQQNEDNEDDNDNEEEPNQSDEEQQEVPQSQNINVYKGLRVFLVSATLTHEFKAGSKFQFLKKGQNEVQNQQDKLLMKQIKATIPKLQSLLGKLKIKEQPYIIDLTQALVFPETLRFYKSLMEEEDKLLYIYHWIKQYPEERFIIFLNSITYANKVTSMLRVLGLPSVTLHSQQQQRQRLSKLDQFTEKKCNLLVCTDVAARGLDIVGVENVIHFQVPYTADTFVHRCGRTARINKEGKTLILIGPKDQTRFTKLESDVTGSGIEFIDYKLTFNQVKQTRDLVKQAQKLEKEDHSLNKKKNQKDALQKQLKNEDCDIDEKELKQELANIEEELLTKRKKLDQEKLSYQQIVASKNKLENRFDRRRNGLFLTPEQTMQLAERLKQQKERQLQKTSQPQLSNVNKKKNKGQHKQQKKFNAQQQKQ